MRKNNEVDKKNNSHHHHHHGHLWTSLSFQLHMPHLGHDKEKAGMPPKGCMVMWVGQEGEAQQRFVVPVVYLNHPLFAKLLEEAEKEYGFDQRGAIVIPCGVDHFRQVQDLIDREGGAAPAAGHSRRHNDQHQNQHRHRQVVNDHANERACAAAAAAAGGGHRHGDHHHHRQHSHHHLPHFAACFGA